MIKNPVLIYLLIYSFTHAICTDWPGENDPKSGYAGQNIFLQGSVCKYNKKKSDGTKKNTLQEIKNGLILSLRDSIRCEAEMIGLTEKFSKNEIIDDKVNKLYVSILAKTETFKGRNRG